MFRCAKCKQVTAVARTFGPIKGEVETRLEKCDHCGEKQRFERERQ